MTTTEPQPQPQESPLALWNEQVQHLAAPEHADEAINAIHENLMGLHTKMVEAGNHKSAAKIEHAYNQAVALYNTTTQQGAIIAGGSAAITATDEQRQQAVTELAQLMKAITDVDESHPKLAGYAESIRQDEYESSMFDDNDDGYYAELYDDEVRSKIEESWEVIGMQANLTHLALTGEFPLKKEHADLLQRLISEMPTDYAGYQAYKQAVSEESDEGGDE